ncbi:MAG: HD domain-containing protein [Spirochaetes bacterium]|nr:HD domain-containing protein [Spirochaetota bacterium]MBN2770984.1 HD domain-containing protein [Spirochaetota bacterium]
MKTDSDINLKNLLFNKESNLSKFACLSKDAVDLIPLTDKASPYRTSFGRDVHTIMQTNTYARYMDKTQVFYLFSNQHITHRSLHVQFVSYIARTIGRFLNLNEDLIEAISLGHDLGHPAFGHEGESILNSIAFENGVGAFAHNAQSVRALLNLENNGLGVPVSLQVADGILAHNGEMLQQQYYPCLNKTANQFYKEFELSMKDENHSKNIRPMTMEGCAVKIADVIAYIGRDIEDAIKLKMIKHSSIPREISKVLGQNNDQITETLIGDLISSSYGKEYLGFSMEIFSALCKLKEFNYKTIYFNPLIKSESKKIHRMFHLLFDLYFESLIKEDESSDIFIHFLKDRKNDYNKKTDPARVVIDFMASMTDSFIVNQFNKLFFPKNFGYSILSE